MSEPGMTEPFLELEGVSVSLGGRRVVEGVSLTLPRRVLVGIVGPNGAGKTSLLRAIAGLIPHAGGLRLEGTDLATLAPGVRARRVAYLPQGHLMHWPLPVREVAALGRYPHGVRDPARLDPAGAAAVERAMRLTDTLDLADRPVTELSGGERARVALARVFAVEAPLVLADEPTAALDPRHQIELMEALRQTAEAGALVLAVTHDLALAARFCHLVVVLARGRLAASGPAAEALSAGVLATVFGVRAFEGVEDGLPVVVPWAVL
jgi:iron complex transport system ATP-binding protein